MRSLPKLPQRKQTEVPQRKQTSVAQRKQTSVACTTQTDLSNTAQTDVGFATLTELIKFRAQSKQRLQVEAAEVNFFELSMRIDSDA